MRSQSDDRPEEIWMRYVDSRGVAFVRLRRDIKEMDVLDAGTGKSRKAFDYEEVEVEIVDRPGLAKYVRDNLVALFELGLEAEKRGPVLSDREEIVKVKKNLGQLADTLAAKGVITAEEKDQIAPKITEAKGSA